MAAPAPRAGQTAHTRRGPYTLFGALDAAQVADVVKNVRPAGWQYLNAAGAPAGAGVPPVVVTPCPPPLTVEAMDAAVAACDALPTPAIVQCSTATRAAAVLAASLAGKNGDPARLARLTGFNAVAPPTQAWLTAWSEGGGPGAPAPPFFRLLRSTEGSSTHTYLVADAETREAVIIDPVLEHAERDAALVKELGFTLLFAVNTHVHADHVTGGTLLRGATGCRTLISAASGAAADGTLADGDAVVFGRHALRAIATPGHTPGCITLVLDDEVRPGAFTGDALLVRACGRTDFQGGSAAELYSSVTGRVFALPARYAVWPAHNYDGVTESTVGEERKHNPRLGGGKAAREFVALMAALNLPPPVKMDVAVPRNMRDGDEV